MCCDIACFPCWWYQFQLFFFFTLCVSHHLVPPLHNKLDDLQCQNETCCYVLGSGRESLPPPYSHIIALAYCYTELLGFTCFDNILISAGSPVYVASWARFTLMGGLEKEFWVCSPTLLGRWVISVQFLWFLWSLFFYSLNSKEPLRKCCFTEGVAEQARRSWGNIAIRNVKSVLHFWYLSNHMPWYWRFHLCNFILS